MKIVIKDYDKFLEKSEELRKFNSVNFTLDNMKDKFESILKQNTVQPKEHKLVLPKLTKVN
jgi:hypothetical protein